jgi:hypothetical protein
MKRCAVYPLLLSFALVAIISCSGSSGSRKAPGGSDSQAATDADPRPAKRLIEVLAPADNASFSCTGTVVFSVAHAADRWRLTQYSYGLAAGLPQPLPHFRLQLN